MAGSRMSSVETIRAATANSSRMIGGLDSPRDMISFTAVPKTAMTPNGSRNVAIVSPDRAGVTLFVTVSQPSSRTAAATIAASRASRIPGVPGRCPSTARPAPKSGTAANANGIAPSVATELAAVTPSTTAVVRWAMSSEAAPAVTSHHPAARAGRCQAVEIPSTATPTATMARPAAPLAGNGATAATTTRIA